MAQIRLRLGDFTACAFVMPPIHEDRLAHHSVKDATIYLVDTAIDRRHALAILYYMESAPAFFGDDADLVERSAIRRTSASWRKALGLTPHAAIPVPYTANRIEPSKPTPEELAREAADGDSSW